MLPINTAPNLYNRYCQWQTPTSTLHRALGRDTLWAHSQMAGWDALCAGQATQRIALRAKQYGFAAGASASLLMGVADMVVGTGRDRGAPIVGPNLAASAANHLGVSLEHFGDTGLLGLVHAVPVVLHAGFFAGLGAAVGGILSAGDWLTSGGAAIHDDTLGARCRRRVGEWAGLGAVAGAALVTLAPQGLAALAVLGTLRVATAAAKACLVAVAFAAGATIGAFVECAALGAGLSHPGPQKFAAYGGQL